MSFVIAQPEMIAASASDLASIGSTISEANAAAAGPTTAVLAAGADEVSAAIAALFGEHGQAYQAAAAARCAGPKNAPDPSWPVCPVGILDHPHPAVSVAQNR